MKIQSLTGVMLTNRNDIRLENALKSLQICSKIIIIDNNSKADWKKLQNKYSLELQIIKFEKKMQHFANAKNMGLKQVETEWVLFLDSDETLLKETQIEIQELILGNLYDVISFKRTDIFLGKEIQYGEAGTVFIPRLFKTKKARFLRPVHEILDSSGKYGQAKNSILHHSHESISDFLQKVSEYAKIESDFQATNSQLLMPKLVVYPIAKFILNYFIKLGFLDGFRGLVYAVMMSLHSFFVRVYGYEK